MKWREYIASKAAGLCFLGIAALLWGIFAYFAGANAAVLWGSEIFFACAAAIWLALGFFSVSKRLKKLEKTLEGLKEPYLLGELLEKPRDAAEKEYFRVMKEVSRSAIGTAETALKEKEEYCEYVESWIHEIKTPLTACSLILDNSGDTGKLKRELKRADNLTETILYYARLRSSEKPKGAPCRGADRRGGERGFFRIHGRKIPLLHPETAFNQLCEILPRLPRGNYGRGRLYFRFRQRVRNSLSRASTGDFPRLYGRERKECGRHGYGALHRFRAVQKAGNRIGNFFGGRKGDKICSPF